MVPDLFYDTLAFSQWCTLASVIEFHAPKRIKKYSLRLFDFLLLLFLHCGRIRACRNTYLLRPKKLWKVDSFVVLWKTDRLKSISKDWLVEARETLVCK